MPDFDDFTERITTLFKRGVGTISTHINTPLYKETNGKNRNIFEGGNIKIERAPTTPTWNETSLTPTELANLKFDSNHFSDTGIPFSSIHMLESDTYKTNGSRLPGVYYDTSNTVALVVRLKLDRFVGDANMDASAIVYTKYKTDSSNDSLLDNAYQFNYNTQINVGSPTIPVFKPYNYILEYSPDSDSSNFQQVTNDIGNWSFDNNNGIITFEADPSSEINLSSGNLYLTFVKYIGVCGFDNLLYYKDKKIGIGTKEPNTELDVSGSVNITGSLEVGKDLHMADDVLYVDSSNKKVGINTIIPLTELEVFGDAIIRNSLDISNGMGGGFCPIGTILMWSNLNFTPGYGEWLICDGITNITTSRYPALSTILGANGNFIKIPNYQNKYIRGATNNDTEIISGGNSAVSFTLTSNKIPYHTHNIPNHTHIINDDGHSHVFPNHSHIISDPGHTHSVPSHNHNVVAVSHGHDMNSHTHTVSNNASHTHNVPQHTHTYESSHRHEYRFPTLELSNQRKDGKSDGQNAVDNIATEPTINSNNDSNLGEETKQIHLNSNLTTLSLDATTIGNSHFGTANTTDTNINSSKSGFSNTQNSGQSVTQKAITVNINNTPTSVTDTGLNATSISINNNVDFRTSTSTVTPSTVNCVLEPNFHTLFFFIRAA